MPREAAFKAVRGISITVACQVLDSIPLEPRTTTGNDELDQLLDTVFSQIITEDMDTHDKLKACYDYLITHTVYGGNSYWLNSYADAYGVLTEGRGVCDDYSAAFAVMARKIGVPMYTVAGDTHKSNGEFTPHTWCHMDYNGTTYVFDPQVEDVIADGRGGSIMYIRFGGTTGQLADKYHLERTMDDFSKAPEKGEYPSLTGMDEGGLFDFDFDMDIQPGYYEVSPEEFQELLDWFESM